MTQLQQHLVRVGDLSMHVTSGGSGTPITFLHPVGLDASSWEAQLAPLADRYQVIVPDLRGHGTTTRGTAAFTLDTLGEDIIRLWDALGISSSHLVGLSMGGMVAEGLALRAPERVRSLVLVNTAGTLEEKARALMLGRARAVSEGGMSGILEATLQRWFNPESMVENTPAVAWTREKLLAADPAVHAEAWQAIAVLDYAPRLGQLTCPTLVVVGETDVSTPVPLAEALVRAIPGAGLHVVPGAAHMFPVEHPGVLTRILTEFL